MIWKSTLADENYTNGDTHIRRRFAWVPTRIDNCIVWLEKYDVFQMYVVTPYKLRDADKVALVAKWVDLSKKIIK